jgi:hypothetical protein
MKKEERDKLGRALHDAWQGWIEGRCVKPTPRAPARWPQWDDLTDDEKSPYLDVAADFAVYVLKEYLGIGKKSARKGKRR